MEWGILTSGKPSFKLSPNPTTDILYVANYGDFSSSYSIYDTKGSLISVGSYTQEGISTAQLNQGLYLLQLEKEGMLYREKFIKN